MARSAITTHSAFAFRIGPASSTRGALQNDPITAHRSLRRTHLRKMLMPRSKHSLCHGGREHFCLTIIPQLRHGVRIVRWYQTNGIQGITKQAPTRQRLNLPRRLGVGSDCCHPAAGPAGCYLFPQRSRASKHYVRCVDFLHHTEKEIRPIGPLPDVLHGDFRCGHVRPCMSCDGVGVMFQIRFIRCRF
jgi:hypothetical protein